MKYFWYILLFIISLNSFSQPDTTIDIWIEDFESYLIGKFDLDSMEKYWEFYDSDHGWINVNYPPEIVEFDMGWGTNKCLRIYNPKGQEEYNTGMHIFLKFDQDYDELYISYHIRSDHTNWSEQGHKNPGLVGYPYFDCCDEPGPGEGFRTKVMSEDPPQAYTYNYHHDQINPLYGEMHFVGAVGWQNNRTYLTTQRGVMNTFTSGNPNSNGIMEVFVNRRKLMHDNTIQYFEDEGSSYKIDGCQIAIYRNIQYPTVVYEYDDHYWYIDNIHVYQLEPDFCTANGFAQGLNLNPIHGWIYTPIASGTLVDNYDALYTDVSGHFCDNAGCGDEGNYYSALAYEMHGINVKYADSIILTMDTVSIRYNALIRGIQDWTSISADTLFWDEGGTHSEGSYTIYGENAIILLSSTYYDNNYYWGFAATYQAYGGEDMYMYEKRKTRRNQVIMF